MTIRTIVFILAFLLQLPSYAEDGYKLWLGYKPLPASPLLQTYKKSFRSLYIEQGSPTFKLAQDELLNGVKGLIGQTLSIANNVADGSIVAFTLENLPFEIRGIKEKMMALGDEGFLISREKINDKNYFLICANKPIGLYYGAFHFLRTVQNLQPLAAFNIESKPHIDRRILNHWDNLDRTVERGYAGFSLWNWHKLPDYIDPRYHDYARANASIGINGTVLTNVNANALILSEPYLQKVKALADIFRPYGIKVYLTARFSAPLETGGLPTADPLDPRVREWWKNKTKEIYSFIPDFGGFLVKANSEGQPGPQNYQRTHADGANMLAQAVAPFGGIVMWRAFVYDNNVPTDRVKQAYNEFKPLDGNFDQNVLIQVKNGPLDFQPREPFHPLFGAMTKTPLMMEFQLTQEYLGFSSHLVYLATLFKETLDSETFQKGEGSSVRKVVDGSLYGHKLSAIAGVANIGNERNWCGHPFAQANWYSYGRLTWDQSLGAKEIADEWISQTFSPDKKIIEPISSMMMASREITVNYMTPLGLHHIMGWSHHYGPAPWIKDKERADWTSVYYHKADSAGVGFNRTESGSNALEQYHPLVRKIYADAKTCPENYLLWFHHVPWNFKTTSGRTLWEELCFRYNKGATDVQSLQQKWNSVKGRIDPEQFDHVSMLLKIQQQEAWWWHDACLLYFQTFSGMKIPSDNKQPQHTLEYYQSLEFPFAPGIRPRW